MEEKRDGEEKLHLRGFLLPTNGKFSCEALICIHGKGGWMLFF